MSLHLRSSTSTLSLNSYQSHDSTDDYSEEQKALVTSSTDAVARSTFEKSQEVRRSSRSHKPSRRKLESEKQSKKRSIKIASVKRSKKESSRKHKKQRVIRDKKYLHHYPLSTTSVSKMLATLDDQRQELNKLSKREVVELDRAITLSANTGAYPGIRISSLSGSLGQGVFLDPDGGSIKKETVLGIYSGEYKVFQIDHLEGADLSYAFELTEIISLDKKEHLEFFGNLDRYTDPGDYVVYCDAKEKGNWSRYLNHGGRYANCEAELVRYPPGGKMGADTEQWIVIVRASKRINPGEQLLLNYGRNYWKKYGITPSPVKPTTFTINQDGTLTQVQEMST